MSRPKKVTLAFLCWLLYSCKTWQLLELEIEIGASSLGQFTNMLKITRVWCWNQIDARAGLAFLTFLRVGPLKQSLAVVFLHREQDNLLACGGIARTKISAQTTTFADFKKHHDLEKKTFKRDCIVLKLASPLRPEFNPAPYQPSHTVATTAAAALFHRRRARDRQGLWGGTNSASQYLHLSTVGCFVRIMGTSQLWLDGRWSMGGTRGGWQGRSCPGETCDSNAPLTRLLLWIRYLILLAVCHAPALLATLHRDCYYYCYYYDY